MFFSIHATPRVWPGSWVTGGALRARDAEPLALPEVCQGSAKRGQRPQRVFVVNPSRRESSTLDLIDPH